MRHTRRMTTGERWELGLFLAMVVVGCLCFTAILKLHGVPRIFAWQSEINAAQQDGAAARPAGAEASIAPPPVAAPQSALLEIAPQPSFLPEPMIFDDLPAVRRLDPAPAAAVFARAKAPVRLPAADIRIYNGQKYRFVKTLKLRVTAYAADPRCTYPYPGTTTASGLSVKTNGGKLVAADTRLISMHSLVVVPGYAGDKAVPVLDRGGAIKGARLDVLLPTFDKAKDWGSRNLEVKVYAPVDK